LRLYIHVLLNTTWTNTTK